MANQRPVQIGSRQREEVDAYEQYQEMERKLRQANQAMPGHYGQEAPAAKAGYQQNKSRAMVSVAQGKERIFGLVEEASNHGGDSPGTNKGKRIMRNHQETKLF